MIIAAVVLFGAAIAEFFYGLHPVLAWMLLFCGAGVITLALQLFESYTEMQAGLARAESEASVLQAQVEQQQSDVDVFADGLAVSIFICDSKATILYANSAAETLFRGIKPVGRPIIAISLNSSLENQVLATASTGDPITQEFTIAFPEDREVIASSWTDPSQSRVFVSIFDISELKRLERVRQDFVANVSHELRTPLTIMRALAETLLDDETLLKERAENYLPRIVAEVDRLTALTQDLLLLSASEQSKEEKVPVDLSELVQTVANSFREQAKSKGLEFNLSVKNSLQIQANASQVTQVVINLIQNALNYTVTGSVSVSVYSEPRGDRDMALISVKDTGIGIAVEHVNRIYERFYRVDKGRSRESGGTGLGLSIVRHIVENHGGQIELDTRLHHGSEFRILFPLIRPQDQSHAQDSI